MVQADTLTPAPEGFPGLALEQAGKGAFGHAEARAPFADRFRGVRLIEEGGAQGDEAAIAGHGEGKAYFGEQGELVEQDGNHPGHWAGLLIVAGLRGEGVDEFADEGRNLHGVVTLKTGAGRQDMRHDVQGIVHGRLRDVPFMGQPGRDPHGPLRRRGIVAEFGTDDHVSGAHERQFAPVLMPVQIAPRTRFERVVEPEHRTRQPDERDIVAFDLGEPVGFHGRFVSMP